MKCTKAYVMEKLKERLGPDFEIFEECVIHKEPIKIKPGNWFRKSRTTHQVLFRYHFSALHGIVKVRVHDGFRIGDARNLFDLLPVILELILDSSPDNVEVQR